jgi:hypothetical protein
VPLNKIFFFSVTPRHRYIRTCMDVKFCLHFFMANTTVHLKYCLKLKFYVKTVSNFRDRPWKFYLLWLFFLTFLFPFFLTCWFKSLWNIQNWNLKQDDLLFSSCFGILVHMYVHTVTHLMKKNTSSSKNYIFKNQQQQFGKENHQGPMFWF